MRLSSRPAALTAAATLVFSGLNLAGAAPASADVPWQEDVSCSGPAIADAPTHESNTAPVAVADTSVVISHGIAVVDVVANDTDEDGDALTLVSAGSSRYGSTCIDDGQLVYVASGEDEPRTGIDKITYAVTDGDSYRRATVTFTYADVATADPRVTQRLVVKKKKVVKSARIEITNPDPTYTLHVAFGDLWSDSTPRETVLKPGATRTIVTGRRALQLVTYVSEPNASAMLQYAYVDTRTGSVQVEDGDWYYGDGDYRHSARTTQGILRWARATQR